MCVCIGERPIFRKMSLEYKINSVPIEFCVTNRQTLFIEGFKRISKIQQITINSGKLY